MSEVRVDAGFVHTLVYFEYRKILRQYGGSMLNPNRWALLSVGFLALWLVNFGVYAATFTDGTLKLQFWPSSGDHDDGARYNTYIAGSLVHYITFALIVAAVQWDAEDLVWYYFFVLFGTLVCSITIKMLTKPVVRTRSQPFFSTPLEPFWP